LDADDALLIPALHDWQKVVLKPAVSASAHGTILVTAETAGRGQAHLDRFLATHDMLMYARVDLIHDEAGILRLMELELVEPGLWLSLAPQTVRLFADAIAGKMSN
jgi:hypothetical protein